MNRRCAIAASICFCFVLSEASAQEVKNSTATQEAKPAPTTAFNAEKIELKKAYEEDKVSLKFRGVNKKELELVVENVAATPLTIEISEGVHVFERTVTIGFSNPTTLTVRVSFKASKTQTYDLPVGGSFKVSVAQYGKEPFTGTLTIRMGPDKK
jgi:hypothetical protein